MSLQCFDFFVVGGVAVQMYTDGTELFFTFNNRGKMETLTELKSNPW